MALARPDSRKVNPRFLLYYFLGPEFQEVIRKHTVHGSTVDRIPLLEFPSFPVRLPPREAQDDIASSLGSLDDKIDQNRKTAAALERLARAIFKAWFVDFEPVKAKAAGAKSFPSMPQEAFDSLPTTFTDSELGPVPEGWEVKALSDAFEVNPHRLLRKGVIAPCLEMKHMPTQGHAPDTWTMRPFGSGTRFQNGDTLVARITPCLENGKTAYVDFLDQGEVAWGSTEYIVLRPRSPLPSIFAYCLARTDDFRAYAIQSMSGTSGRQRVAPTAMDHFFISTPGESVAAAFGRVAEPLFDWVRASMTESRSLMTMREYLLPRLLSGDVRVSSYITNSKEVACPRN